MVELTEICRKCGGLCETSILFECLSAKDMERLKKHGWVPKADKLTDNLYLVNEKQCKFFRNGRCTIYEDRPLMCRLYPLDFIPLISGDKIFLVPTLRKHDLPDGKTCPMVEHINLDDLDFLRKEAKLFVQSMKEQGNEGFRYYILRQEKSLIGL